MILASASDSFLRAVIRHGARADEDILWREGLMIEAVERGFPRLLLLGPEQPESPPEWAELPVLRLTASTLEDWEAARRRHEVPPRKVEYFGDRLRDSIRARALRIRWIDGVFRDLTQAAGASLPRGVKGVGRRVMEFPAHYRSLGPLAEATGYSPGSLKGRFRRRGLESPSLYLRWFRSAAVVHVLTGRDLSYRQAAYHLGFSGSANLCRFLETTTGLTPGQLTEPQGRERLLTRFASRLLDPEDLAAWQDLDRVFLRRVA